jgi:hypothetical protein
VTGGGPPRRVGTVCRGGLQSSAGAPVRRHLLGCRDSRRCSLPTQPAAACGASVTCPSGFPNPLGQKPQGIVDDRPTARGTAAGDQDDGNREHTTARLTGLETYPWMLV